jgi:hypothetical protein
MSELDSALLYNTALYNALGVRKSVGSGSDTLSRHIIETRFSISVLLIIFFAFLAIRIDNKNDWSWAKVFVPLWIADVFICAVFILLVFSKGRKAKEAWWLSIYAALCFVPFIMFQLFIVLREDQVVEWSAAIIFLPYWISDGFYTLICLTSVALLNVLSRRIAAEVDDQMFDSSFPRQIQAQSLLNTFTGWCARSALTILIVLKLDGKLDVSWATVFIPTYLLGLYSIIVIILDFCVAFGKPSCIFREAKEEVLALACIEAFEFITTGVPFYIFIGLLVGRLESPESLSMAVVFIPIFIALSASTCSAYCSLSGTRGQ